MPEQTIAVTLEFTEQEYATLKELVREKSPDGMTPEKYVYLEILKHLHIFLCGVTVGMDKMKRVLITQKEQLQEAVKEAESAGEPRKLRAGPPKLV